MKNRFAIFSFFTLLIPLFSGCGNKGFDPFFYLTKVFSNPNYQYLVLQKAHMMGDTSLIKDDLTTVATCYEGYRVFSYSEKNNYYFEGKHSHDGKVSSSYDEYYQIKNKSVEYFHREDYIDTHRIYESEHESVKDEANPYLIYDYLEIMAWLDPNLLTAFESEFKGEIMFYPFEYNYYVVDAYPEHEGDIYDNGITSAVISHPRSVSKMKAKFIDGILDIRFLYYNWIGGSYNDGRSAYCTAEFHYQFQNYKPLYFSLVLLGLPNEAYPHGSFGKKFAMYFDYSPLPKNPMDLVGKEVNINEETGRLSGTSTDHLDPFERDELTTLIPVMNPTIPQYEDLKEKKPLNSANIKIEEFGATDRVSFSLPHGRIALFHSSSHILKAKTSGKEGKEEELTNIVLTGFNNLRNNMYIPRQICRETLDGELYFDVHEISSNFDPGNKARDYSVNIYIPKEIEIIGENAFLVDDYRSLTIFCEAEQKPTGFADNWTDCPDVKYGWNFDDIKANSFTDNLLAGYEILEEDYCYFTKDSIMEATLNGQKVYFDLSTLENTNEFVIEVNGQSDLESILNTVVFYGVLFGNNEIDMKPYKISTISVHKINYSDYLDISIKDGGFKFDIKDPSVDYVNYFAVNALVVEYESTDVLLYDYPTHRFFGSSAAKCFDNTYFSIADAYKTNDRIAAIHFIGLEITFTYLTKSLTFTFTNDVVIYA